LNQIKTNHQYSIGWSWE